jgi:hypothetical protein
MKVKKKVKVKNYDVYLLFKKGKPVYVGCSCNLNRRLSRHKLTKDFDSSYILKSYKTRKEALIAENSIIRFISLFGGKEWLNSKDIILQYDGLMIKD